MPLYCASQTKETPTAGCGAVYGVPALPRTRPPFATAADAEATIAASASTDRRREHRARHAARRQPREHDERRRAGSRRRRRARLRCRERRGPAGADERRAHAATGRRAATANESANAKPKIADEDRRRASRRAPAGRTASARRRSRGSRCREVACRPSPGGALGCSGETSNAIHAPSATVTTSADDRVARDGRRERRQQRERDDADRAERPVDAGCSSRSHAAAITAAGASETASVLSNACLRRAPSAAARSSPSRTIATGTPTAWSAGAAAPAPGSAST